MQQYGAHCHVNHVARDIDSQLVVAYQASPPHEPAESALDHPAVGLHDKSFLSSQPPYHLDGEIHERGLVHQGPAVIGGISEQVLHPRPALLQGIQNHLSAGRIGYVCHRQVHRQQPTIRIDRYVALAPANLLVRVVHPLAMMGPDTVLPFALPEIEATCKT